MSKSYYEILNVSKTASVDQIKKAYHNLAKVYHPDLKSGNTEKFKEISEAYSTLSNPLLRREYDSKIDIIEEPSYTTSTYTNTESTFNYSYVDESELTKSINILAEVVTKLAEISNNKKEKVDTFDYGNLSLDDLDYFDLDQLKSFEKTYRERTVKILNKLSSKEKKEYSKEINTINNNLKEIEKKIKDKKVQKETEWYYLNPVNESIFTILFHFTQYRFENAMTSLWKRWTISILFASFVYVIAIPFILLTKILFFFRPGKERYCYIHWIAHVHNLMYRNHLITTVFWAAFLLVLSVIKFIWSILYIIYWTFKNIIRFILLPISVLVASIIIAIGKFILLPKKI